MNRLLSVRVMLAGLSLGLLVCLSGCGGGDGTHVSGKVTFQGQGVPGGRIYFIPDGKKGNSGPTGYADIKDGEYDTSASGGKITAGGPMLVAIEGMDPSKPGIKRKGDTSGEETFLVLFQRYEINVDLPKSSSTTKDFDVPASAGKRRDDREKPMQAGP